MELPPIVIIIGSYFAMAGGVWALFDRADKALKDEAKQSISQWLLEPKPGEGIQKWHGQFIKNFDAVFGEKHLSWKCFFRSCVASYIAITIMILIFIGINGTGEFLFLEGQQYWKSIALVYMIGGVLNMFPDYVSLLETRYILYRMKSIKSFPKLFFFLGIDLVLSTLLILLSLSILSIFSFDGELFSAKFLNFIAISIKAGVSFSNSPDGSFSIFFYSTFFTSVWLWLYGLSGLLIKTSQRMGRAFQWLKNILDFENKPLPSLGLVSNFIILFFYLIGFGFFYDGKYL